MGIDISSKLLVGRYAEDILGGHAHLIEGGDVEYLEDLGLERVSEYYDSDPLDSVWGIAIANGSVEEVITAIKKAEADFFNLTGIIPRVYQLPDVW